MTGGPLARPGWFPARAGTLINCNNSLRWEAHGHKQLRCTFFLPRVVPGLSCLGAAQASCFFLDATEAPLACVDALLRPWRYHDNVQRAVDWWIAGSAFFGGTCFTIGALRKALADLQAVHR